MDRKVLLVDPECCSGCRICEITEGEDTVRRFLLTVLASVVVLAVAQSLVGCGMKKTRISIATASVGGSYYPIGVGMAEVIKQYVPTVDARVVVTGGAGENPKLVGQGENHIGITNSNLAYDAYLGQGDYQKEYSDLRLLFSGISPGSFQTVVAAGSPIASYSDLKGRNIAVGSQGGDGALGFAKLLPLYGFQMSDIKPSYLGFDDGVAALQTGQVEAAVVVAPLPSPGIKSLASSTFKFRMLPMTEDKLTELISQYPYYARVTIPKDMYGRDSDILVFGTPNIAIVTSKLGTDVVYRITKAIFEHLGVIALSHPSAKSLSLKNAPLGPIPLHPGAEKYYKEVGAIK